MFYSLVWASLFFRKASAYDKQMYMVPMRDGIRLATDVFVPSQGTGPWPTILVRTPYGKHTSLDDGLVTLLTDIQKYVLAVQDTRGRFDSEGVDSLFFHDGWGRLQDGYDTVEWIALQSWCDGKVGTWGLSALGITQYLLAGAAPPHLSCCYVMVAASNLYEEALFYGGAYRRSLVDGWLRDTNSEYLLDYFIQHPNYEPIYDVLNLSTRYDSVVVPIFHVGGWHDVFIQGQINAFCGIQERGGARASGHQKLRVGPWTHKLFTSVCGEVTYPHASFENLLVEMIEWFDYWLKDRENGIDQRPSVRYYLMGNLDRIDGLVNRWIDRDDWPPPCTPTLFYLREGGSLSQEAPDGDERIDEFDYDPDDPVPTVGGRNLNIPAGCYDQRSVESRDDVLVYTTEPLDAPLGVAGRISVTVWASSDAVDTDFTAKLCDVYPDGRSMLVADGIVRARHRRTLWDEEFLTPGQTYEFPIDLWSTAIVFDNGHRIRLAISSSNFDRFETNPNTGGPFRQHTTAVVAHQTVYHDLDHPSAVILPVIDISEIPVAGVDTSVPLTFLLKQNVPNPFNGETLISMHFPPVYHQNPGYSDKVRLEIYNLRGQCVKQWDFVRPVDGSLTVRWHGDDHKGRLLPSGIYVCRLTDGSSMQTIKMTLIR